MRKHPGFLSLVITCLIVVSALLPAGWTAVDTQTIFDYLAMLDENGFDVTGDGGQDFRDLMQVALHWGEDNLVVTPTPTATQAGGSPTDTPTATSTPTDTPTPTLTDTPTPTPTQPGGTDTPTPTPTSPGGTFDFADFFPMGVGDTWHYVGDASASQEDNFSWTVLADKKDVGGGVMATDIHTTVDDPNDARDGDEDFWFVNGQGDVIYYGLHNGKPDSVSGGGTYPAQDVILTDPLKIGTANMTVGQTITDSGAGSVVIQPIGTINATFTSNAHYTALESTHVTALGTFTNVLRLELTIDASVTVPIIGQVTINARKSTFFFKQGVGMIAQDQQPDPNDAEAQSIDSGTVNGTAVVAGKARAQ